MKDWLTWKTGAAAVGALIVLVLVYGVYSNFSSNQELKRQLKEKQKEAEDARKQADAIQQVLDSKLGDFEKRLNSQKAESDARIAQLQNALSASNAIRAAAANAYQQQHQQNQAQLAQVSTASTTGLIQVTSGELKLPVDTFNALPDRVQVGNDSFRAITQRILECKDVSQQNVNLQVQSSTLQKDKEAQAKTIEAQSQQINTLIEDGKTLRADVKKQIEELNKAHADEQAAKEAQIKTLKEDLKKERSFFGNLKRTTEKIGAGVLIGLGVGAFLGI